MSDILNELYREILKRLGNAANEEARLRDVLEEVCRKAEGHDIPYVILGEIAATARRGLEKPSPPPPPKPPVPLSEEARIELAAEKEARCQAVAQRDAALQAREEKELELQEFLERYVAWRKRTEKAEIELAQAREDIAELKTRLLKAQNESDLLDACIEAENTFQTFADAVGFAEMELPCHAALESLRKALRKAGLRHVLD